MKDKVKVAGCQTNPKLFEIEKNIEKCLEFIDIAAKKGAELIVFPECALTGVCFKNLDEALSVAEPLPGPSIVEAISLSRELRVYTAIGHLEREHGKLYNSLAFMGPEGFIAKYRKIHPSRWHGVDRFVTAGNKPFKVYDTNVGKIGLNICFDVRITESARVLALLGAEIIVLPANWAASGGPSEAASKFVINTRAYENVVNYMAINRVGEERRARFIGKSKIIDYFGNTLAQGSPSKEEILYAELDLEGARSKRVVIIPDKYEFRLFEGRRPEFYNIICGK
jgi:predicted amidohydrolase